MAGRLSGWLHGWFVGWLVGWTCCSNFAPFGNLSSRISMPFSLSLLHLSSLYSISSSVFLSSQFCVPFFLARLLPYSRFAEAEPKKWPCKLPPRTMATPQLFVIPLFSEMQPGASRLPSTSRCGYLKLDARNFAAFVTIDDAELSSVCWRSPIPRKVRRVRLSLEHWLTKLLSRPRLARKKN